LSAPAREGFVATRFGRTWYRVVGERGDGAEGAGAPLLVIHGGPGLPSDYLEPLAELADERPVVFYDQLGCGRSDRPADPGGPAGRWTTEHFLGELWKVRQALGFERIHLYGHSWGSQVAVEYALTRPEGVLSWVLADPPLCMPRWLADLARYRAELPDDVRAVLDRCEAEERTGAREYAQATRAFYDRHFCRIHPWPAPVERALAAGNDDVYRVMWGASEFHMTGVLRTYDRSDRLAELDGPVLFLCGRHDEATPETTAWYRSLVPGAELLVVEEASHLPHLENPAVTLPAIRDFLRRAEAQPPAATAEASADVSLPSPGK
jgi:proline iminopeptidase